jgi:hypothetical protein
MRLLFKAYNAQSHQFPNVNIGARQTPTLGEAELWDEFKGIRGGKDRVKGELNTRPISQQDTI